MAPQGESLLSDSDSPFITSQTWEGIHSYIHFYKSSQINGVFAQQGAAQSCRPALSGLGNPPQVKGPELGSALC